VSKNEAFVSIYLPHQSFAENPAYFVERADARRMKKDGRGYFQQNGKVFRLAPCLESDWEEIIKRYNFRSASATIQPRIMFDYVLGKRQAVALVESWRVNQTGFTALGLGGKAPPASSRGVDSPSLA